MIPPKRTSALCKNPLNPVKDSALQDLFVDVDDSKQAFEQFQQDFSDPQWLSDGAVVIASGSEQSGKTALLYRCAWWLQGNLGDPDKFVKVLDCTDTRVRDDMSIDSRVQKVVVNLRNKIFQAKVVEDSHLLEMSTPEEFFPYVAGAINSDAVVVAILPNSADLTAEIATYADFVPERVMLLTETPYVAALDSVRPRIERSRAVSSFLRLGLLNDNDGELFYGARRAMHPADAVIPPPADGTLEQIVRAKETTIGELQRLLYELYDELPSRPTAITEVTYAHVTDYWFRKGGRR